MRAALAVAVLLLFGRFFLPSAGIASSRNADMYARTLPLRSFVTSELKSGNFPLWNPRIFAGVPNHGGLEAGLLYPPHWLVLPLSLPLAMNALMALHVFLAGLFAYLWFRRKRSEEAAVLGAGAFMLGGALVPHAFAGHLPLLSALAWTPAVLGSLEGWWTTGNRRWLMAAAVASAMQVLAGHPQAALYTAVAAAVFGVCLHPGNKQGLLVGLAAVFGGALLLSVAQWGPGLEAALESVRARGAGAAAFEFSLPPENLLTLLAPNLFGTGLETPYVGRGYLWEMTLYSGVGALLLAACAAAEAHGRRLLLAAGILLVLALGGHTPVYPALCALFPPLYWFRGPCKFDAAALLLLCAAAAAGLDSLQRRPRNAGRAALGAGFLAGALALCALALRGGGAPWAALLRLIAASRESYLPAAFYADPLFAAASARQAASALWPGALAAAAAAGLLWLLWRGRRAAALGLAALALVEGLAFSRVWIVEGPREPQHPPETLRAAAGRRAVGAWETYPNAGLYWGYDEVWGYDQLVSRRYAELMAEIQGQNPREASMYLTVRPSTHPVMALLQKSRGLAFEGKGGGRRAVLSAQGTDFMEIEAETAEPALLVVSESWSSGWKAEGYEVRPARHALIGVALPAGKHAFRLEYAPRSWPAARWASSAGWLLLLFALL